MPENSTCDGSGDYWLIQSSSPTSSNLGEREGLGSKRSLKWKRKIQFMKFRKAALK